MLYTAILFGLVSSLHCIGMCGPIAMMLPVDNSNSKKKIFQVILYHLGRLATYVSLGLLFGLLGRGLYLAGIQQYVSIVVGVLMIVIVLVPERTFMQFNFSKPVYRFMSFVKTSLGEKFKKKSLDTFFVIGLLNGLLPCGLVYVALFGAIAMPSVVMSASYMFLYGVGTIPLMTAVVYISKFLSFSFRKKYIKLLPLVAIIIGVLFVLRGMGLDIPFISPSTTNLFIKAEAICH